MLAPARAPTGALVGEMAGSSQVHGDAGFRRRRGHLVIAHRAPGVHDRLYSRACQRLQSIREGEERIGGRDRTTDPVAAAFDGQPGGVDPVDLPHPDADGRTVGGNYDRIRLDRATGAPREDQVGQCGRVGR